jgi:hypothetical protein
MFLALRELRFARSRFALMGAVVALIAVLMVLLSGHRHRPYRHGEPAGRPGSTAMKANATTRTAVRPAGVTLRPKPGWPTRPTGARTSSPAANGSASASPGR